MRGDIPKKKSEFIASSSSSLSLPRRRGVGGGKTQIEWLCGGTQFSFALFLHPSRGRAILISGGGGGGGGGEWRRMEDGWLAGWSSSSMCGTNNARRHLILPTQLLREDSTFFFFFATWTYFIALVATAHAKPDKHHL